MDKKKMSFVPPPLSEAEKEKKIKKILSEVGGTSEEPQERDTHRVTITMRVPAYYIEDIERIRKLTGQTKNAIYIEIMRSAIKLKLKELLAER